MSFSSFLVAAVLVFMLVALMREYLRPGLILFTAVVLLLVAGIITPEEAIKGFSNKGMITVALLYLVSEGVRKSGILERIVFHMLPKKNASITSAGFRFYPIVSFISAFFNNTPVVVIFAPMIKNWARKMKLPPTKFLIPLSYATVIGGICTLIGTTTNLVLHGMLIQEYKEEATAVAQGGSEGILMRFGIDGMSMFELTKVGIFIALAGLIYLIFFSKYLLPNNRMADEEFDDSSLAPGMIRHEVLLGNRFPGLGKTLHEFDFFRHYGAHVRAISRNGNILVGDFMNMRMTHEDTLIIDNGARGTAEDISITGGREVPGNTIQGAFVAGVWSSAAALDFIMSFSDGSNTDKDFMSLTAMDYAQSIALPRIELTGKIDVPSGLTTIPFVLSLRNVYHQMKNYHQIVLMKKY